jgi:hypothetical protein
MRKRGKVRKGKVGDKEKGIRGRRTKRRTAQVERNELGL